MSLLAWMAIVVSVALLAVIVVAKLVLLRKRRHEDYPAEYGDGENRL